MTSKSSFFRLMREDLKLRLWTIALSVLVCFLSYPVAIGLQMDAFRYRVEEGILHTVGPQYAMGIAIAVIGAIICGLSSFYYLTSRKKVDLYHSIPIKRERLFACNFINGILIYLIPYIGSFLLSMAILGNNNYMTYTIFITMVKTLCIHFVFFLLFYSLTVIAAMLTGNIIVTAVLTAIFLLYGLLISMLKELYFTHFFTTYFSWGISQSLNNSISKYFSPIYHYGRVIGAYYNGIPVWNLLIKILLFDFILIGIGLWLYKKRPSEAAGAPMAFSLSKPIIKYLLVLPTTLFGGMLFKEMSSTRGTGWYWFGIIFTFFLSYGLIEIVYNMDIRKAFRGKIHLAVSAVSVIIIVIIFHTDLFGYDTYIPEKDKIESMSVMLPGIDRQLSYLSVNNNSKVIRVNSRDYELKHMNLTNFDAAYELAKKSVPNSSYKREKGESVDYYQVKYRLKNGKEVYRIYQLPLNNTLESFASIYEDNAYKEAHFSLFSMESKNIGGIEVANRFETKTVFLDKEQRRQLLEIYKEELRNLSLYEVMETEPKATIVFQIESNAEEEKTEQWSYMYHHMEYNIYPGFVRTIEFLKGFGVDAERKITSADVKAIYIHPNGGYRDSEYYEHVTEMAEDQSLGESREYTSKEEIDEILSNIVDMRYFEENYNVVPAFRELGVEVVYMVDEYNTERRGFNLLEGRIPEFVAKDFLLPNP